MSKPEYGDSIEEAIHAAEAYVYNLSILASSLEFLEAQIRAEPLSFQDHADECEQMRAAAQTIQESITSIEEALFVFYHSQQHEAGDPLQHVIKALKTDF